MPDAHTQIVYSIIHTFCYADVIHYVLPLLAVLLVLLCGFLFTAVFASLYLPNCISQIECFAIFTSILLPISWMCVRVNLLLCPSNWYSNVNANVMLCFAWSLPQMLPTNWFLNSWFGYAVGRTYPSAPTRDYTLRCSLLHFNIYMYIIFLHFASI